MQSIALTMLFSILMLLLFSATDASMQLFSQLGYQYGLPWFGPLVNGLNSASVAVGCFFSYIYLETQLSFGKLLFYGSLCYALVLAQGLLVIKCGNAVNAMLISIISIAAGLGTSTIYMCQDLYVAGIA